MVLNYLINGFHLAVGLRVYRYGEIASNFQLRAHSLILLIVKLSPIISDQHVGDPKEVDYAPLNKIASLGFSKFGQRFHLYSLSKVI